MTTVEDLQEHDRQKRIAEVEARRRQAQREREEFDHRAAAAAAEHAERLDEARREADRLEEIARERHREQIAADTRLQRFQREHRARVDQVHAGVDRMVDGACRMSPDEAAERLRGKVHSLVGDFAKGKLTETGLGLSLMPLILAADSDMVEQVRARLHEIVDAGLRDVVAGKAPKNVAITISPISAEEYAKRVAELREAAKQAKAKADAARDEAHRASRLIRELELGRA